MFLARAQLVLAVAPDEDDNERAKIESEGHAETDGDFEEGGRKARVRDSGIVVVERDIVEGGFGDGVIGWGIGTSRFVEVVVQMTVPGGVGEGQFTVRLLIELYEYTGEC